MPASFWSTAKESAYYRCCRRSQLECLGKIPGVEPKSDFQIDFMTEKGKFFLVFFPK
jgi:hypothetical protein